MLALSTYGFILSGHKGLDRINVRPDDEALDDSARLAIFGTIADLVDDHDDRFSVDFR
jgi:hypothetical protein